MPDTFFEIETNYLARAVSRHAMPAPINIVYYTF